MSLQETGLFNVSQCGTKTVLCLQDQNVDFRNCEAIKTQVRQQLQNNCVTIILDLSQVTFMDSSGLGVLMFCKRLCDEAGGCITLCCVQQYVDNLLTLTNLKKAIAVFATQEEAING
jgi:anti-sigma B factor antagonist